MNREKLEARTVGWNRWLGRAHCLLTGHRYYVLQVFSPTVRRVQCTRCGGDWGMNDRVHAIVEWDAELEEMQRMFGFRIRQPKFSDGAPLEWPNAGAHAKNRREENSHE